MPSSGLLANISTCVILVWLQQDKGLKGAQGAGAGAAACLVSGLLANMGTCSVGGVKPLMGRGYKA